MTKTTIWWVRKEFRLADNPALLAALNSADAVIPVFILDPEAEEELGAAPLWRLSKAIECFQSALAAHGSRLILRRGVALPTLRALIEDTGASRVVWGRHYDAKAKSRDTEVKSALKEAGIEALSVRAHLLREPWELETKTGGPYRVYSPFKRSFFASADLIQAQPAPENLKAPSEWPRSDVLASWGLESAMQRGGAVVAEYARIGEAEARARLDDFLDGMANYDTDRDRPDRLGTSRLSENLAWGEISPAIAWQAASHAIEREPKAAQGGTVFLQELIWREFAYHLLHHYPALPTQNWREEWDGFPWRGDNEDAERWRRGQTGVKLVDAAMRELYTTGYMHNRMRMLTASYLCKHLMTDWRVGEAWFRNCLIDWDPASNAMGWQWVAGSGPDATPFFRIFNPETQRKKFDPQDGYVSNWLPGGRLNPSADAVRFYDAVPASWSMSPKDAYPEPVITLDAGRKAALDAYQKMRHKTA